MKNVGKDKAFTPGVRRRSAISRISTPSGATADRTPLKGLLAREDKRIEKTSSLPGVNAWAR